MQRKLALLLGICLSLAGTVAAQEAATLESAEKMYKSRSYEAALILIDNVADNDAQNAPARFLKGQILEKLKLNAEAVAAYDECVVLLSGKTAATKDELQMLEDAKKNVLRLDPARKLIIDAADELKRKAQLFKGKDEASYEQLNEMVETMYGEWNAAPGKLPSPARLKKMIEKRALAFARALAQDNIDAAIIYVDPRTRTLAGDSAVITVLRTISKHIRNSQLNPANIQIKAVALAEGRKGARVTPSYAAAATAEGSDQYWVEVDGKWYIGDDKELMKFKEEKSK